MRLRVQDLGALVGNFQGGIVCAELLRVWSLGLRLRVDLHASII